MLQFDSIELNSDGRWKFTWSGSPTDEFKLVQDGRLLAVVTGTEYIYPLPLDSDDPPSLELVGFSNTAESEVANVVPHTTFQWYAVSGARNYMVEELVDGEWQIVGQFAHDPNVAVYTYSSHKLEDGTNHEFRVTSYNMYEEPSTPVSVSRDIVCHPDFKMNQDKVLVTYVNPDLTVSFEV